VCSLFTPRGEKLAEYKMPTLNVSAIAGADRMHEATGAFNVGIGYTAWLMYSYYAETFRHIENLAKTAA
jgi:hypothetical protein